jgi:lipopolysaccharide transport system ATP-binding protein
MGKPSPWQSVLETDYSNRDGEFLWALKDVSFKVEQGEALGIIGRNGAGKSTLLKILSRITSPSSGKIKLKGRVVSLLEVGTGFHGDLTGRENIYLNGAILGMSRLETERKFDEIVDFSGVEQFIDTPVKRYSSGMYVRLAFAVAAHLEPEILVVDEVLAVGDIAFQKKCLGKMGDVTKEGRTVLFVSHNMGAIESLCTKSLLLTDGSSQKFESAREGILLYLGGDVASGVAELSSNHFVGPLANDIKFQSLRINGSKNVESGILSPSDTIELKAAFTVRRAVPKFRTTFSIFSLGVRLLSLHDTSDCQDLDPGDYEAMVTIQPYFLRPGEYSIALGGYRSGMKDYIWGPELLHFQIADVWDEKNDPFNYGLVNAPLLKGSRIRL